MVCRLTNQGFLLLSVDTKICTFALFWYLAFAIRILLSSTLVQVVNWCIALKTKIFHNICL